jgi:tRNA pseudouridine55 synthase
MLSGILNINKPPGVTSFHVVSRVRRLTGIRKIGHAGTLDPMASGVLPICIGRATRMVEYLLDQPKTYRGRIRFGVATDTYDSEGQVTAERDASALEGQAVEWTLGRFAGDIDQVPPMYSALKRDGRPLYEYAREGKRIDLPPRPVRVYSIELIDFEAPYAEIAVECGRGFYVRSLAHDLGEALGCGAHLAELTRTRSGPFSLEEATPLNALEAETSPGSWEQNLFATDRAVERLPAMILGEANSFETRHGRPISFTSEAEPEVSRRVIRAYSDAGDFLALLEQASGSSWRARKVFDPA